MSWESRPARPRNGLVLRIAAFAVVALLAFGATVGVWLGVAHGVSVATIEDTIRGWGGWGVAGSIGLMVLHSFVPFPGEFLAFANGMLYGTLWGTLVTWVGAMLGAFAAFGLARLLGRPFVATVVSARNWQAIDDWTERQGWQVLLVSRFLPVIAFNLINYAAGLTRVSWWTFAWTTGIGILPVTVLMVTMGDHHDSLGWRTWALMLGSGIGLWLAVRLRYRFSARRRAGDS